MLQQSIKSKCRAAMLTLLVMVSGAAYAEDFSQPGLYIKTEEGYKQIPPYNDYTLNYSNLGEIPWVNVSQPVELVANMADLNTDTLFIYTRPLGFTIERDLLSPRATRMDGKDNLYHIELGEMSNDNVLVYEEGGTTYAVTLTNPRQAVIKHLSNTQENALTAQSYAVEALKAFPDDGDIVRLKDYWDEQVKKNNIQ